MPHPLLAVAIGLTFLFGLSFPAGAAGREPRPVRSLLEMRQDRVVMQEFDLSCGAAALATLLNHQHGEQVTEREIATGLIQRAEYVADPRLVQLRQGFSLLDLKRAVERRGYRGVGLGRLTTADLIARAPAIVPVNFNGYNHFVVFRGALGGNVLLADPAYGNRTMPLARFERAWLDHPRFGRIAFLVARRDGLPPPNRLAPQPADFPILNQP